MSEILELVDKYKEIIFSERNLKNKELYSFIDKEENYWFRDMWRGIPKKNFRKVPLLIIPDNQIWHHILKIDLKSFYSDSTEHLKQQLRMYIYKFENWEDNYYFDGKIYIWFNVMTEISFFGPKVRFFEYREPWMEDSKPLINQKEKLDKLDFPDFHKSGLMPLIHKFYEEINEMLVGKLNVIFPNWARGPFCLAVHLRGLENLLIDMIEDQEFFHKLMRFIVDSQKKWIDERAKFLGIKKYPLGTLFNDEIGSPMISPKLYENLILPYEIELAEYQGGILYWHSCNNTTDFYQLINKIPNLKMMHVSPWADLKEASNMFQDKVAVEKCIIPEQSILSADENKMKEDINKIIQNSGKKLRYLIRVDAIEKVHDLSFDLDKLKTFVNIYNKIMESRC